MNKRGFLVTLEGGEGTGKTSTGEDVYRKLKKLGVDIEYFREPGTSRIGEEIREVVKAGRNMDMSLKTEALLFQASRAQFVEEILEPALTEGKIVMLDRFRDSSEAYQGFMRGLGMEKIKELNDWSTNGLLPDLSFFFDLDPEIGLKRKGKSIEDDRLDSLGLREHQKVREGYWILVNADIGDRWQVIDASKPKGEVIDEVYRITREKLQLAGYIERPQPGRERLG